MKRYFCYFSIVLIILILTGAGLCQEKGTDRSERGIGGIAEGHTVSEVQKAYGNEYGELVKKFYHTVYPTDPNKGAINPSLPTKLGPGLTSQYLQDNDGIGSQALEMTIDILRQGYSNGKYEAIPVTDGDILTRDDHYKITFQSNMPCYVYIVQLDTTGKMDPLFPSRFSNFKNPVKPNVFYEIPSDKYWFFLDENRGTETVYFIACREQRGDIETVFQEIEGRNSSLVQQNKISIESPTLLQRGIAGVRPGDSLPVKFEDGSKGVFDSTVIESIQAEIIMTRHFYHR